jgi:hypothetical protein
MGAAVGVGGNEVEVGSRVGITVAVRVRVGIGGTEIVGTGETGGDVQETRRKKQTSQDKRFIIQQMSLRGLK